MFAHLTLFVAWAAIAEAQAGAPAEVVVAGPIFDVAMTAGHVWALQEDALVMLSHEGQILRRLPLPTQPPMDEGRGQAAAQAARDNALFNKFGVPDTVRDTTGGEDWLDDNRTRADKATPPPASVKASLRGPWTMRASRDVVYVASEQGAWQVRDDEPIWRHVAAPPASGETQRKPADLSVLSTCNGGGRVFANAREGLFVLHAAASVSWHKVHGPIPFPQLRCTDAAPDVLLAFAPRGAGGALSLDAGGHWQNVPGLEGQPAIGMVATESIVWVATAFGLLAVSPTAPAAPDVAVPRVLAPPAPSKWRTLLPQVHLSAQWQRGSQSDGRQTAAAAAFLSAEFLLNGNDRTLSQAAQPPIRSQVAADGPGAQAQPPPCLTRLRDTAAALALADPERMRAMATRARRAGWLPELRFRAEKRWGRNQSLDLDDGTTIAPLGLDTVNDLRVEVRATWDLARAVYSPDELAVAIGTLRVVDARQELMTLVNRLFFERRRLAGAVAATRTEVGSNSESAPDPTSGPEDREPLLARLGRLTADIDALTGGLAQSCW